MQRIGFRAEHHGGQYRSYIRAEKVGAHAGYVAHVIAYVVGDGGGVARVIFGDAGFYFTYKVGAYVGSFGIDTAAYAGKKRNAFCAEREAGEHFNGLLHLQQHQSRCRPAKAQIPSRE